MSARLPGPGDAATWPPCTGHPNDPRTPEPPEWSAMSRDERAAELADLSREELVELVLDGADDLDHEQAAVAGLRRRIGQVMGARSDDWRYWNNAMLQALRWLDMHNERTRKLASKEL